MRGATWPGYTTDLDLYTPGAEKSCTAALGTQGSGTALGSSTTQIQNSRFTRENSAKISTKAVVTIFYYIVFSPNPTPILTLILGIHYGIYGNKEYSGFFKGGNFNGFGV
jgi:hypothetical protein